MSNVRRLSLLDPGIFQVLKTISEGRAIPFGSLSILEARLVSLENPGSEEQSSRRSLSSSIAKEGKLSQFSLLLHA